MRTYDLCFRSLCDQIYGLQQNFCLQMGFRSMLYFKALANPISYWQRRPALPNIFYKNSLIIYHYYEQSGHKKPRRYTELTLKYWIKLYFLNDRRKYLILNSLFKTRQNVSFWDASKENKRRNKLRPQRWQTESSYLFSLLLPFSLGEHMTKSPTSWECSNSLAVVYSSTSCRFLGLLQ